MTFYSPLPSSGMEGWQRATIYNIRALLPLFSLTPIILLAFTALLNVGHIYIIKTLELPHRTRTALTTFHARTREGMKFLVVVTVVVNTILLTMAAHGILCPRCPIRSHIPPLRTSSFVVYIMLQNLFYVWVGEDVEVQMVLEKVLRPYRFRGGVLEWVYWVVSPRFHGRGRLVKRHSFPGFIGGTDQIRVLGSEERKRDELLAESEYLDLARSLRKIDRRFTRALRWARGLTREKRMRDVGSERWLRLVKRRTDKNGFEWLGFWKGVGH